MSRSRPSNLSRRFSHLVRRALHLVEPLEPRQLLSAAGLNSVLDNVAAVPAAHGEPAPVVPPGYSPAQVSQAYGFNQISFNGTAGTGAGETIAIVDAYGDPKIGSDLHAFDQAFGLADPKLSVVNQTGGTRLPAADSGWDLETSLDVEWAHAMAPAANILLVEANNSSLSNLLAAVDYARNYPGVVAVSMSWGAGEFSSEASYDNHFTTPSNHVGITFVAASGDSGGQVIWPAASPNVLSVGGTTLSADSLGDYEAEKGWNGSGGGLSAYEPEPVYQATSGLVSSNGQRAVPDVAYNADPNSGVPVYDSISSGSRTGWFEVGGTSAAAPQWAALIAVADQGRQLAGESSLPNAQASLYSLASSSTTYSADFHDVTSGTAGDNSATAGYDLVTGLGTPIANSLALGLVSATATPNIISAAALAAETPNVSSSSASETTTDPANPVVLIELIFFTPHLIDSGPFAAPIIIPATTINPAPATSLVMPADTPVHFATNSILVDDPLDVPLKPAKRRAAGDSHPAPPVDEAPAPDATVPRDAVFRVWQSGALNDVDWGDDLLAAEACALPRSAESAAITDACFAEDPLLPALAEPGDMVISAAGLMGGTASQFMGLTGMFLAALLFDQRQTTAVGDAPSRRTWLPRPASGRKARKKTLP